MFFTRSKQIPMDNAFCIPHFNGSRIRSVKHKFDGQFRLNLTESDFPFDIARNGLGLSHRKFKIIVRLYLKFHPSRITSYIIPFAHLIRHFWLHVVLPQKYVLKLHILNQYLEDFQAVQALTACITYYLFNITAWKVKLIWDIRGMTTKLPRIFYSFQNH